MPLNDRHKDIIRLVAEQKQMTTTQLRRAKFHDVSRVAMGKVLRKLRDEGYLEIVGSWTTGLATGKPPSVYQPTKAGWQFAGLRARVLSRPHEHNVWTAEAYVTLVEAQRRGDLRFAYDVEIGIAGGDARADMRLRVVPAGALEATYFYIEVEVCDKSPKKIREKLAAYVYAWQRSSGFPYVIVPTPDEKHERKLRPYITELGEKAALFRLCTVDRMVETIKALA